MISKWQLLVLGTSFVLGACGEAPPRSKEDVSLVRTIIVDLKAIDDDRRAVGEIRPRHESDLSFRLSGKVIERLVDVGAHVKKGDLLARLDDQDHRNKLTSAETDVAGAEAVLVEARAAEGRLRPLLANGVSTRANYEGTLKNLRSAEAKLEAARAALKLARDQVAYCELRADFAGIVTSSGAEAGQVVNAGQMIVRLARPQDRDAVFSIAEAVIGNRRVADERPAIQVALLSNTAVVAEGVVREISPIADPVTRTYQVKVTLHDFPEPMRFGASVAGRLKMSTASVFVLPAGALFDKGGAPAVWVVDPGTKTVQLKPIVIDHYETDRVIVRSGLEQGEIVVTAGVNRLRRNQKVRLAEGNAP